MIDLDLKHPVWEHFFMVAPLIVVGTRETDGAYDLAPKHMVAPLSWQDHFGFVCTPSHATYANAKREGAFTVSFPRPDQVILASLAAAPRCEDSEKHSLEALQTIPATKVNGVLLKDAYLHFECKLDRVIDDFDVNSLIVGRIIAAAVAEDSFRDPDVDDHDMITRAPLLAYLYPGRFARISDSEAFPFHTGFKR